MARFEKRVERMRTALLLVLIVILALFIGITTGPIAAQDESPVAWKEPEIIYTTDGDILMPSEIVADAFGRVHIFWSERALDDSEPRAYINYLRQENDRWTWPVDILRSSGNEDALMAKGVVGSADALHLIWRAPRAIEYSYAAATTAESGNSWIAPENILDQRTVEIASFLDKSEQLHIGFAVWEDGIYHMQYDLRTSLLSNPVLVNIPASTNSSPNAPLVSVGDDGTIHMWWTEVLVDDASPLTIFYSRSEDGGQSWSLAKILHEGSFRAEDVAQRGDEIHILLLGSATERTRGHLWSADGGLTWSEFIEIVPSEQGTGRSHGGIVIDDNGTVFTLFGMNLNNAVGYASWDGSRWSKAQVLPGLNGQSFEDIRLTIGNGNRLHAIFVDGHQKLLYAEGITQAAARPTPEAIVPIEITNEENNSVEEISMEPTVTRSVATTFDNPPPARNTFSPIMIGVLAAVLLVGVVVLVVRYR